MFVQIGQILGVGMRGLSQMSMSPVRFSHTAIRTPCGMAAPDMLTPRAFQGRSGVSKILKKQVCWLTPSS